MLEYILNMTLERSAEFLQDIDAEDLFFKLRGPGGYVNCDVQDFCRYPTPWCATVKDATEPICFVGGPAHDKVFTGEYAVFVLDRVMRVLMKKHGRKNVACLFSKLTTGFLCGSVK